MTYASKQLAREKRAAAGRCRHNLVICSRCIIVTDAARRMSDAINDMLVRNSSWDYRNCWMAFRLDDGSTDNVLYDSKVAAIKHCSDEKYFAFFCFRNAPGGSNPRDCQIFLDLHRHAYDAGGHLADPDAPGGGGDMIVSTAAHDHMLGRGSRPTLIPGIRY